MKFLNGRLFVAAGIMLMLAGLLAFSFAAPNTTVGQETDVPVDDPTDVGSEGLCPGCPDDGAADEAQPPASLPDTGYAQYGEGSGSARIMLIALLGALGLTLAGAGAIATRRGQRASTRD